MSTLNFMKKPLTYLVILCLLITPPAFSMSALPSLHKITDAMNLNREKITNLKVRTVTTSILSANFFSLDQAGATDGDKLKPFIVHGNLAYINRHLTLLYGDNKYVDENRVRVGPQFILQTTDKYWFNASKDKLTNSIEVAQSLDKQGRVAPTPTNGVNPVAYAYGGLARMPIGPVDELQIYVKGLTRKAKFIPSAKVVRFQDFKGLKCVRVEWGEKDTSSNWGYALICPLRDWKIVYSEGYIDVGLPRYKRLYQKMSVEKFQNVSGNWTPSSVYQEQRKIGYKGEVSTSREQVKVIDFEPDAVNVNLLFEPLLSPGTQLIDTSTSVIGGNRSAIGGSIKYLIAQIQNGDFSFMKEDIGDLSK